MVPESLFHNLSPMNPGIVILEYVHVIREEKTQPRPDQQQHHQITALELSFIFYLDMQYVFYFFIFIFFI